MKRSFDLKRPLEAFQFLLELYNFESIIRSNLAGLNCDVTKLRGLKNEIEKANLPAFTSGQSRKRKRPSVRSARSQQQRHPDHHQLADDLEVVQALRNSGYIVEAPLDPDCGWVPLDPWQVCFSKNSFSIFLTLRRDPLSSAGQPGHLDQELLS